jgi:type IV secretion system protein VirB2
MKKEVCKTILIFMAVLMLFTIFDAGTAYAGTSTGLPWEASIKLLSDSLHGPVAFALGLFMIVCGFCAIAFTGADMGAWVRWVAVAAILIGMLGAAPTLLPMLGLSAAMIK